LSDNKIEREKNINKFKKISNVKKLREYKRLLILILREEIDYVISNWEINNETKIDQIGEKKVSKKEIYLDYVTLEENILVTWFLEKITTTREVLTSKSRILSNFNYVRTRSFKFAI